MNAQTEITAARPVEWSGALLAYQQAKAFAEALAEVDDEAHPAALDACNEAMDHLVENVRAPNAEATCLKIELGRERWDGFSIPDEWLDALAADVMALAGPGSHAKWLRERDELLRACNTKGNVPDEEAEAVIAQADALEVLIFATPARDFGGMLVKALLFVGNAAEEMHSVSSATAAAIFAEAKALGLIEYAA